MTHFFHYLLLILLFTVIPEAHSAVSSGKLKALYNSIDPSSVSQHLAFYDLYPNTPEGQKALQDAYRLLAGGSQVTGNTVLPSSLLSSIQSIVGLVNKHPGEDSIELSDSELATINTLANRLPNRRLAGYRATTEGDVLKLPTEQIDLTRGVLLSQLGSDPDAQRKIKSYEAAIDLMALQILTRVSLNDSPKMKIRAINHFIFEEMGFRFPPQSSSVKDIDLYTFLPSVLDSRRGVCLGVSILYVCLAQRLNLELEIITPPGHIFVRYCKGDQIINIETTARGIHLPDEEYLGVDTRALEHRNVKETIGLAHANQAAVFLERQEYGKALDCYAIAKRYVPHDKHLIELMGYTCLMHGDESQAKPLLEQVAGYIPDYAVSKETIAEDYLKGRVNGDGVKAILMHVDQSRSSLLAKKEAIQKVLDKYPNFRDGIFSLAGTWLQLHRAGEALFILTRYHDIDPTNATVEYYLSVLYAERLDYNKAWYHLKLAEQLVRERDHDPKALHELRQELVQLSPE